MSYILKNSFRFFSVSFLLFFSCSYLQASALAPEDNGRFLKNFRKNEATKSWKEYFEEMFKKDYEEYAKNPDVLEAVREIWLGKNIAGKVEMLEKKYPKIRLLLSSHAIAYAIVKDQVNGEAWINKLVSADPENPTVLSLAGLYYFEGEKYEKALPYFEKSLALNFDNEPVWRYTLVAYLSLGKYADLRKLAKKVLDRQPTNEVVLYLYGHQFGITFNKNDLDSEFPEIEKTIKGIEGLKGQEKYSYMRNASLGALYFMHYLKNRSVSDASKSTLYLELAVKLEQTSTELYTLIIFMNAMIRNVDKVTFFCSKASEAKESLTGIAQHCLDAYLDSKQEKQAVQIYREFNGTTNFSCYGYLHIAWIFRKKLKEYNDATVAAKKGIPFCTKDDDKLDIFISLIATSREAHDYKSMLFWTEKAISSDINDEAIWYSKVEANFFLHHWKNALDAYDTMNARNIKTNMSARLLFLVGVSHFNLDNFDKAKEVFSRCISISDDEKMNNFIQENYLSKIK